MSPDAIEVLSPGAFTTIQDRGRFGFAHLGISPAGAADSLSMRIANRIAGNREDSPAMEMTLVGAKLQFRQPCTIALTGADVASSEVPMFEPVVVDAGFVLDCGPLREGARTYLAVAGALAIPKVLGSASTHFAAGFGGFDGRALKRGDVLTIGKAERKPMAADAAALRELTRVRNAIRVTPGLQYRMFDESSLRLFRDSAYLVTEQSNRLGLRLSGPAITSLSTKELLTEGVSLGAIQIPPNGQPIILFVDQQTTGGYPKLANVIAADMHCIGQLRPRDSLRFEVISVEEAILALRDQESRLAEVFGE